MGVSYNPAVVTATAGISYLTNNGSPWVPPSTGSTARQPATNGNVFPFSNSDSANTNNVRNSTTKKWLPTNGATYSQVQLTFPWFAANPTSELAAGSLPQVTIRASVVYNRVRYQLTFGGNVDMVMNQGDIVTCDVIPGLVLDATVSPYLRVNTRIIGPSGSNLYPRSITCHQAHNEGTLLGTNATVDYTDATTIPIEAEGTATVVGGNITAVNITYAGANYTQAGEVYAEEYDQYGHAFYKQIGTFAVAGGVVTGVTITDGTPPTDGPGTTCTPAVSLTAWVNPRITLSYGTANFNNVSRGNTPGWTSCLVSGIPNKAVKSLAIWGNSLPRGNGQGVKPDILGNFGVFEIGAANGYGVINYGIGSGQAQYFRNMAANYPLLGAFMQSALGYTTHGIIDSATNDIALSGRSAAQVTADINTMGAYMRVGDRKVTYGTLIFRGSSSITNDFINGVFTPTTGFGAGGVAETVQSNITGLSGITIDYPLVRTDLLINTPGSPMSPRTNITCITTDGVHEIAAGLGYARVDTTYRASLVI